MKIHIINCSKSSILFNRKSKCLEMTYPANTWFHKIWIECKSSMPEIILDETEVWHKIISPITERVFVWAKVGVNVVSLYLPLPLESDEELLDAKTSGPWRKFESRYRIDAADKIPKAIELIKRAYTLDQLL